MNAEYLQSKAHNFSYLQVMNLRPTLSSIPTLKFPTFLPSFLAAVLELERQDSTSFQPLPFHYQEVAHCLFTAGIQESLPREVFGDEHVKIRDLIGLIEKARYKKILDGLQMMQEAAAVKLNNLSAMELNTVRAFFTGSLDQFHRYSKMAEVELAPAAPQPATAQPASGTEAPQPVRQLRRGG